MRTRCINPACDNLLNEDHVWTPKFDDACDECRQGIVDREQRQVYPPAPVNLTCDDCGSSENSESASGYTRCDDCGSVNLAANIDAI